MDHVEHLWTIVSRGVTQDEQGISIVGLVDMVPLAALPATRRVEFNCCVLSYWRRNLEPGTSLRQRLVFRYEVDGTRWVLPGVEEIVLTKGHLFCVIRRIAELPIGGWGQHMFVVQRQDSDGVEWVDAPPTAGLWVASPEMVAGGPTPAP